ncbi:uncharacterized protein LOC106729565 isoform X1 [Camelus ferus]|uniref:Uncharacterized protein LOC106729565 isoform X1 n=1 Tax=Camelus ferus TaxID=419612 RepID=A0A8B8SCL0_CAMFR|nr:uncharacterized protein LOC106729565 isoform X1 [Camelus ferus]
MAGGEGEPHWTIDGKDALFHFVPVHPEVSWDEEHFLPGDHMITHPADPGGKALELMRGKNQHWELLCSSLAIASCTSSGLYPRTSCVLWQGTHSKVLGDSQGPREEVCPTWIPGRRSFWLRPRHYQLDSWKTDDKLEEGDMKK